MTECNRELPSLYNSSSAVWRPSSPPARAGGVPGTFCARVNARNWYEQNYRRLVTQWEYRIENFLSFVQLACLLMLLRDLREGF